MGKGQFQVNDGSGSKQGDGDSALSCVLGERTAGQKMALEAQRASEQSVLKGLHMGNTPFTQGETRFSENTAPKTQNNADINKMLGAAVIDNPNPKSSDTRYDQRVAMCTNPHRDFDVDAAVKGGSFQANPHARNFAA